MSNRFAGLGTALMLVFTAGVAAEPPETLTATETMAPAPATIADAAWLSGHWVGQGMGGEVETFYFPPADGAMSGTFRMVVGGTARLYEMAMIVERDGTLVYRLKHFGGDFVGWEAKDEAMDLALVKRDANALYFHRMTFLRDGTDGLNIWIRMENPSAGTSREVKLEYHRAE